MTSRRRAVDPDVLAQWLRTALTRPAREGARIVALHWLGQLVDARAAWAAAVSRSARDASARDAAEDGADPEEQLHRARVALRRLRSTLREFGEPLDLHPGRRTRRALKKFGRATNRARDRDVQLTWLRAERDALPAEARLEATALLDALGAHPTVPVARSRARFRVTSTICDRI